MNHIVAIDKNAFIGLVYLELVCLSNNPISFLASLNISFICDTNSKCTVKLAENCTRKAQPWVFPYSILFIKYLTGIVLTGHTSAIKSVVHLDDGSLASGSLDKTIWIWNTQNGAILRILTGHRT